MNGWSDKITIYRYNVWISPTGLNMIRVQILRKNNETSGFTKDSHHLSDRATVDA